MAGSKLLAFHALFPSVALPKHRRGNTVHAALEVLCIGILGDDEAAVDFGLRGVRIFLHPVGGFGGDGGYGDEAKKQSQFFHFASP